MAGLAEFRNQYPQYADVPDADLADSLHAKFYSDIPKDKYLDSLGLGKPSLMSRAGSALSNFSAPAAPVAASEQARITGLMDAERAKTADRLQPRLNMPGSVMDRVPVADLPVSTAPESQASPVAPMNAPTYKALEAANVSSEQTAAAPGVFGTALRQIEADRPAKVARLASGKNIVAPTTDEMMTRPAAEPSASDPDAGLSDFGKTVKFGFEAAGDSANPIVRGIGQGVAGMGQASAGLGEIFADITGNAELAETAKAMRQRFKGFEHDAAGQGEFRQMADVTQAKNSGARWLEQGVQNASNSITRQIPGLLTGRSGAVLTQMFFDSLGNEYGEAKARGKSADEALARASVFATFEVLGEKLGLDYMMPRLRQMSKGVATEQLPEFFAGVLKRDLPGELFTHAGQSATDASAIGLRPGMTLEQYLSEIPAVVRDTLIQTGMMTGAGSAMNAGVGRIQAANQDLTAGVQFNPGQIDAAARQALDPSNAQMRIAVNPPRAPRAELETILNDDRPVEEILAEQAQQADLQKQKESDLAYQRRAAEEEAAKAADFARAKQQQADLTVDQANALTRVSGFDDPEPTAMQLAMQRAAEKRNAVAGNGTRTAPVKAETAEHVAIAEQQVDTQPTEKQKDAGNYKLGHLKLQGMDIAIENPAGSVRSGVDKAGKPWANTLNHTYGYIKGATAADGDKLDAFIGPNPQSQAVYVIDQVDPDTGRYDEGKVMLGFNSTDEAQAAYLSNYDAGWRGLGAITPMHVDAFKAWIAKGDTHKPLAYKRTETAAQPAQTPVPPAQPEPVVAAAPNVAAQAAPVAVDRLDETPAAAAPTKKQFEMKARAEARKAANAPTPQPAPAPDAAAQDQGSDRGAVAKLGAVYRDWVAKNDHRISASPSDETLTKYAGFANDVLAGKSPLTSADDFKRFVRLREYGAKWGFDLATTYKAFDNGQDITPSGELKTSADRAAKVGAGATPIVTPQSDNPPAINQVNVAPAITRTKAGKLEISGFTREDVAESLKTAKIKATVAVGQDGRVLVSAVGRTGNHMPMTVKQSNAIQTALMGKTAKAPKPRKFTGNLRNDVNLLAPGLYAEVARGGDGEAMDLDMSLVAEQLKAEGFMLPTTETGKDSDAVIELIRQDIANGGGTLNEARQTKAMTEAEQKSHRADVLRLADEYGIAVKKGVIPRALTDIEGELKAAIEQEINIAGKSLASVREQAIKEGLQSDEVDAIMDQVADFYDRETAPDKLVLMYREIANALQERIDGNQEQQGRDGQGPGAVEHLPPGAGSEDRPGFELSGQTEAELRAEQERIDAAKAAEEAGAREAEAKARKEQAAKDKADIQDRLANQPFEFGVGAKEAKTVQRDLLSQPEPQPKTIAEASLGDLLRAAADKADGAAKPAAPVSSVAGQKNLANRGSRIATLKMMNEQIRKLDPTEAWHDSNIEDAQDLDALQDRISQTLVDLQRAAAPVATYTPPKSVKEAQHRWSSAGINEPKPERGPGHQALMDAVRKALAAKLFYNKDVDNFVAKELGVTAEQRKIGSAEDPNATESMDRVEGGAFGYDVYLARQEVESENAKQAELVAADRMKLSVGMNVGKLKLNDGKLASAATVESLTPTSVVLVARRGPQKIRITTGYVALEYMADRAENPFFKNRAPSETAIASANEEDGGLFAQSSATKEPAVKEFRSDDGAAKWIDQNVSQDQLPNTGVGEIKLSSGKDTSRVVGGRMTNTRSLDDIRTVFRLNDGQLAYVESDANAKGSSVITIAADDSRFTPAQGKEPPASLPSEAAKEREAGTSDTATAEESLAVATSPAEIIKEVAKARPFDKFEDVRDAALAAVRERTGKLASEYDEMRGSMMNDPINEAIHDGQYEGKRAYAATLPVRISESGISTEEARTAFMGTSHSPEKRGASARRGLFLDLVNLWRQFEPAYNAAPEDRQASFREAFEDAAARYTALTRAYLSAHGRVMSSMITGPARFPVESNRKKSDAADKRAQEASEYLGKARTRLLKVLRGRIDNSLAAQLAEAETKLAARETAQARMKAVNSAHAKFQKDAASLDKSDLSDADKELIRTHKPRYSWEPHPFAPYELSNNNAEIRRMKDRVEELKRRAEAAEAEPDEGTPAADGVRVVRNAEAGRLQLFFDEKPSEEIRNDLKANGFKWAPSQSAWQRQLTANAEAAANQVIARHFQPKETDKGVALESRAKQSDEETLIIQHNLSAENLLHAFKMGGIPVPSLAITAKDSGFSSFGDITLLGSKSMADPKGYAGTKVFGADIYSPRYPSVEYQFTANMEKRAEAMLKDGIEATGNRIDWDEWQRRGIDGAKRTVPLMWKFLKEQGVEPTIVRKEAKPLPPALQRFASDNRFTHELTADPAFIDAAWQAHADMLVKAYDGDTAAAQAEVAQDRARAEERGASQLVRSYASQVNQYRMDSVANGSVDARATGYEIEAQIRNEGLLDKFNDYAREFFADINPNERIFQGYTNNGRRYVAHTLENVVKMLKKELRGGEGFNYGAGSIRSAFTPQFKSIKQIREAKDRLMDKAAFEAVKGEIDNEFSALRDQLAPYHAASDTFGFGDTVSSTMYDAAKMGIPRALRENGFSEVPEDAQREIAEFLTKLRDLPTEYFEAKILRDVDLSEFSGAVVPEGVNLKVIEALNARGIKDIRTYKKGDNGARAKAVEALADELHAAGKGVLFSKQSVTITNETPATIRAGLSKSLGKATVDRLEQSGLLRILDTADSLPDGLTISSTGTALYDGKTAYLIADRMKPADAVRATLHEIGEHHGLEGMLGEKGYKALGNRVRFMEKAGNARVKEAFAFVRSAYPELREDSPVFMKEILANIGQDADVRAKPWWQEMIAAVRRFLVKLGYGGVIRTSDIEDMVLHSLKTAAREDQFAGDGNMIEAMASKVGDGETAFKAGDTESAEGGATNPSILESRIIGDSGRQYTPDQEAMFKQTGREVDQVTMLGKLREWASVNWRQGLFDQFQPVRAISDKGYTLLRLSKGATGAFEAFMQHGKLSLKDGAYDADTTGGVMQEVFFPLGRETTDFLYWIAGNRAERLAMEGKERLFSAQDIAAAKSLSAGTLDFDYVLSSGRTTRSRLLAYRDSLDKFNAFNKNVMDMAEQSGLIDGASRHLWEHEFYVPFYRLIDDTDGGVRGMNIKQGVVRQQAFKKLKGGKEGLNDLLANTLMNWAHLIDASAKNRGAKETLEAAARLGAAQPAQAGDKNTVWYMDGGKKAEYTIDDPELLVALNALDYSGLRGPIMDALQKPKHWLTIGVTASPFFKVRNLIRDSVQAVATSGLSYNVAGNIVNGISLTNRDRQEYVSALAGGGLIRFGTMLEGNEAARTRQLIKKGAKDEHILNNEGKIRAFYDKYLEPGIAAYNEIGNRGEEINRMSLYDQMIKSGADHATASLMARDLMDFSMQGSWTSIRFLAQVVPFFNARLEGMYKLGRAAKGDPAKFGAVLGAVSLFSLALLAAYSDDDDWKKREDWDRDNYWWFKVGGVAFRIPKPFEIGAIATLTERSAELMFDKEMTGKRFRQVTTKLIADQLSMNPTPQLVKPILDIYANKDSFSGRPIETMGMERLDKERRFTSSTSMPARGLSAATGGVLSPVQIDHLVRGYFAWLGAFAVGTADLAVRMAGYSPDRPSRDYWKFATGGMIAETDSASSRYVSQMYDQAKEIETAYGTWRDMNKQASQIQGPAKQDALKDVQEYRKENADKIAKHSQVGAAKRQISALNERIRVIERSDKTADEKRALINNIQKLKDQAARRVVATRRD